MNKTRSGFTLVEMLVVIAVVGILAVITVSLYGGAQRRARNTITTDSVVSWIKVLTLSYSMKGTIYISDVVGGAGICLGGPEEYPATTNLAAGQCFVGHTSLYVSSQAQSALSGVATYSGQLYDKDVPDPDGAEGHYARGVHYNVEDGGVLRYFLEGSNQECLVPGAALVGYDGLSTECRIDISEQIGGIPIRWW